MRLGGFLLFLAAAISDYVDGHLARTRQQKTDLGALLDPLADKLLLVGTMVPMYLLADRFPFVTPFGDVGLHWSLVVVVLGRELFMTVFRQMAARRGLVIAAIREEGELAARQELRDLFARLEPDPGFFPVRPLSRETSLALDLAVHDLCPHSCDLRPEQGLDRARIVLQRLLELAAVDAQRAVGRLAGGPVPGVRRDRVDGVLRPAAGTAGDTARAGAHDDRRAARLARGEDAAAVGRQCAQTRK